MFRRLLLTSAVLSLAGPVAAFADTVTLGFTPIGSTFSTDFPQNADDGTLGADPALFNDIQYTDFVDFSVWGLAESFYAGTNSFGATSAIDGVEAFCDPQGGDSCGTSAGGSVQLNIQKKSDDILVLPFTITAFDMAIAGQAYAEATASIELQGVDILYAPLLLSYSQGLQTGGQLCYGVLTTCITGSLETGTFPQYARNENSTFFNEARGQIFTADTFHGVIDVSEYTSDEEIVLNYDWHTEVQGYGSTFSAYSVFQDPLGPIQFDFTNFVGANQPAPPPVVPLPAGVWLLGSALVFVGLTRRRWRKPMQDV